MGRAASGSAHTLQGIAAHSLASGASRRGPDKYLISGPFRSWRAAQWPRGGQIARRPGAKLEPDRREHLVHGARRLGTAGLAHDLGGDARDRDVIRHGLHHHRTGGDARAMTDLDIAEDL